MSHTLFSRLHRQYGPRLRHTERLGRIATLLGAPAQALAEGVSKRQEKTMWAAAGAPTQDRAEVALESQSGFYPEPDYTANKGTVAIVGGGFAGLMAGWRLNRAGFCITIYELNQNIGGRVESNPQVPGSMIEAGGELIGANHKTWLKLAIHFGLGLSSFSSDDIFDQLRLESPVVLGGNIIAKAQQASLYAQLDLLLAQLNQDAAFVPPSAPWTAPQANAWDGIPVADWLKGKTQSGNVSSQCADAFRCQLENDQGVPISQQSYLGLLAAVAGGAMRTLNPQDLTPSEYFTETEVFRCESGNHSLAEILAQEIRSHGGVIKTGVRVTSVTLAGGAASIDWTDVATSGNDSASVDWVVLATPPPTWAQMLPRALAGIASNVQTGKAVKFLAEVNDRFWLRRNLAPSATIDGFGVVWEGTDNQNLPPGARPEISVFAGSADAQQAASHWNPDSYFSQQLEAIYPGFSANCKSMRFVNWLTRAGVNCGYSCPGVNQVTTLGDSLRGAHGRLVFAGEHTSPAFFGYMEGALESAEHAADLIIGASSSGGRP